MKLLGWIEKQTIATVVDYSTGISSVVRAVTIQTSLAPGARLCDFAPEVTGSGAGLQTVRARVRVVVVRLERYTLYTGTRMRCLSRRHGCFGCWARNVQMGLLHVSVLGVAAWGFEIRIVKKGDVRGTAGWWCGGKCLVPYTATTQDGC